MDKTRLNEFFRASRYYGTGSTVRALVAPFCTNNEQSGVNLKHFHDDCPVKKAF